MVDGGVDVLLLFLACKTSLSVCVNGERIGVSVTMIDDSVEVVTNMMPDLKEESVGLLEDQSHYI